MDNLPEKNEEGQSFNKYEENPDFNEYLDEVYGEKEIGDISFKSSWILFKLDSVVYDTALREFHQDREKEFKDMVFTEFPTPIAYSYYRSEEGYENIIQRLHFLRDTWEALIFTLFAIVLGEFGFLKISIEDADIKQNWIFSDRLSTKLLIIERLLILGQKNGYKLNSLNLIPIKIIKKIKVLNQIRNGFSHSPALSEEQASTIYSERSLELFSVLHDLENLKDIKLMRYSTQEGNPYNLRCEIFRGHSLTKTISTITIDQDQLTLSAKYLDKKYLLVMSNEQIYPVSPFLHFKQDSTGHQTLICVCKKKIGRSANKKLVYGILGTGGEFELKLDDFQDEISKLYSLLSTNGGEDHE